MKGSRMSLPTQMAIGMVLGIAAGDPVFWIVSITQTPEGVPVEYCRTVARADKVELVSVLHHGESEASDHA